jgi:hypothetical protein
MLSQVHLHAIQRAIELLCGESNIPGTLGTMRFDVAELHEAGKDTGTLLQPHQQRCPAAACRPQLPMVQHQMEM